MTTLKFMTLPATRCKKLSKGFLKIVLSFETFGVLFLILALYRMMSVISCVFRGKFKGRFSQPLLKLNYDSVGDFIKKELII